MVVQSGRSRTRRSSPGGDHVNEFPATDASCSQRAISSPDVVSGPNGCSSTVRDVLPYRCLSALACHWNRASASSIIRTRIAANTGEADALACCAHDATGGRTASRSGDP